MTSAISVLATLLNVKLMTIFNVKTEIEIRKKDGETYTQEQWHVEVAPYKRVQKLCPVCGKKCPGYDTKRPSMAPRWRGPSMNGAPTFIYYNPSRIKCPEHGVLTEKLPWTDGNTRFLKDFNDEATYLSLSLPRSAVAEYLDIDWRTVGHCIKATHDRLEPDVSVRLHGVKRFCVDETSYKKGHKYITVVYDLDSGRVIWVHKDHGLEIFKLFCEALTPEEREQVEIVAGDGARWIDDCKKEYFPNAVRCIDPFHVITWVNKALDDTRIASDAKTTKEFNAAKEAIFAEAKAERDSWLADYEKYKDALDQLAQLEHKRGRRSYEILRLMDFVKQFEADYGETMEVLAQAKKAELTEEQKERLADLEAKVKNIKGCKYALGMNPENLSDYNTERLELLKVSNPDLYSAYKLKEQIRVIIHMTDRKIAQKELDSWIEEVRNSNFPAFKKLAVKIEKHKENILNSIEFGESSSMSEQTNGTIKKLIQIACGFRNLDNMFALIYLRCSDLVIPLANRYRPTKEGLKKKRKRANELRRKRQEAKMAAHA